LVVGSVCDGREELKTAAADEGFIRVALLAIGRHRSQEEIVHWLLWALFNVVRERNRFMTKQVEQSMSEAPRVIGVKRKWEWEEEE
jgi:hypothetical protein